jgi:hypothetical protein
LAAPRASAQWDWSQSTIVVPEPAASDRWRETWAGADATEDGWLVFSGMTIAPFSHIHGEGLRLRLASGYGAYRYSGDRGVPAFNAVLGRVETRAEFMSFEAQTGFAEALVGYLWRLDPLVLKLFAGVSGIGHNIVPFDTENLAVGLDWGPKGTIEMWLNMGASLWGSLDVSWSGAHETASVRSRVGYRILPQLSTGLEGRLDFDIQGRCDLGWDSGSACAGQYHAETAGAAQLLDYSRAGLFMRWEWEGGEISASAGASGSSFGRTSLEDIQPYATAAWIMQY